MGSLGNSPVGVSEVVFYINQEKHIFNASDDLTQSLNDYLRRKTRFKVGHASKPSLLHISLISSDCVHISTIVDMKLTR